MKVYDTANEFLKTTLEFRIAEKVHEVKLGQAFLLGDLVQDLYGNPDAVGGSDYKRIRKVLSNLGFKFEKLHRNTLVIKGELNEDIQQ